MKKIKVENVLNSDVDMILSYSVLKEIDEELLEIGRRFSTLKDFNEIAKKIMSLGFFEINKTFIDKIQGYKIRNKTSVVDYSIPDVAKGRITKFLDNLNLFDEALLFVGSKEGVAHSYIRIADNKISEEGSLLEEIGNPKLDPLLVGILRVPIEGKVFSNGFSKSRYFYITHWGTDIPEKLTNLIKEYE